MTTRAHPYMGNSAPAIRQELLDAVGVSDVEELFAQIPADHRITRELELPRALSSEVELRRHVRDILGKNRSADELLSFLGGGCWQHHVPSICDEMATRTEFVTSEWGTPSSDLGRNQAWFEYQSQMGELLGFDFVGLPVYSWGCAAGFAIRMAERITGRPKVLVPADLDPERLAVIRTYCQPVDMPTHIAIETVAVDPATGRLDLAALDAALSDEVGAIYVENPTSSGVVESDLAAIAQRAHAAGAEMIAGVDPISLGTLAPPGELGVDIAVGNIQPLGIHMHCGGGVGGFIATRDEERYARQYPTLQVTLLETPTGRTGFSMTLFEQTSYGKREAGNDWTGNSTYLWAIVAATYLSWVGPHGLADLGATIMARSAYAAARIGALDGYEVRYPDFFKEFVVDVRGTGRTVAEVNTALLERGVIGGIDLTGRTPELDGCALFCVTEVHTQADIDRLAEALQEVAR